MDGRPQPQKDPAAQPPPRRPDGAPGPRDATPTVPAAPQQGMLASIYEPFQKLATEQKEQQAEQQLAAALHCASRPPARAAAAATADACCSTPSTSPH